MCRTRAPHTRARSEGPAERRTRFCAASAVWKQFCGRAGLARVGGACAPAELRAQVRGAGRGGQILSGGSVPDARPTPAHISATLARPQGWLAAQLAPARKVVPSRRVLCVGRRCAAWRLVVFYPACLFGFRLGSLGLGRRSKLEACPAGQRVESSGQLAELAEGEQTSWRVGRTGMKIGEKLQTTQDLAHTRAHCFQIESISVRRLANLLLLFLFSLFPFLLLHQRLS